MCGLVAIVQKAKMKGFSQKELDMFKQLLYADQLRGSDGTGVFFNSKHGKTNTRILKGTDKASLFIETKGYKSIENILYQESNFAVGHNRAATKGKLTAENAHPFRQENIILVHNGTLTNQKDLHPTLEVDSEALCYAIATLGYKEALKKVEGAFALIWFDQKKGTLNLCRNYARPLYILDTRDCYIIVSELELGLWIAKRNSIIVDKHQEVAVNTLYSFNIKSMATWTEEPLEYTKYKPMDFTPNKYTSYYDGFDDYPNNSYIKSQNNPWNSYTGGKKSEVSVIPKYVQRSFTFGEKVLFRGGLVRDGASKYLEGDILKYQSLGLDTPKLDSDFEDEWRVKVFIGSPEELKLLENEDSLQGTVCNTTIMGNRVTYILTNIIKHVEYKGC